MNTDSATHKLSPIEGLRGYLAMAVMLGHICTFGAYLSLQTLFKSNLSGFLDLFGTQAVNCFMIISGFVIFMLIDRKKEPYRAYILRRFLRIFPIYLFFFLLSIPCLYVSGLELELSGRFQSAEAIHNIKVIYGQLWENIWIHIPLHLLLLQGLIPNNWLPHSATAYLGTAWSLSLEWQFYLLAPLWYALFVTQVAWRRMLMFGVCLFFIFEAHYLFAQVEEGAILPAKIAYFLVGIVSYFIYKNVRHVAFTPDFILPTTFLTNLAVYRWSGTPVGFLPILVWSVVFALFLEPSTSHCSRLIAPAFTNRVSLWLGKVSYGIYLSHAIVLTLVQYLTLAFFPDLTQRHLLWTLLLAVPFVSILLSGLLYRTIEAPFIRMGKRYTGESTRVTLDLKGTAEGEIQKTSNQIQPG